MTNYVVVIRYSFDSDVPVFIFNDEKECEDFIRKEVEKEKKINDNFKFNQIYIFVLKIIKKKLKTSSLFTHFMNND